MMNPATLRKSLCLLLLLLVGTVLHAQDKQQIVLENKTTCTYLIKVNVVAEGSCQPTGVGPLLLLKANARLFLPAVPQGQWVIGYGVEEVAFEAHEPRIALVQACKGIATANGTGRSMPGRYGSDPRKSC